jgi:hypothetical protein
MNRQVKAGILTIVESAAIANWLRLLIFGNPITAFVSLFGGLTLEHFLRLVLFGVPVFEKGRFLNTLVFSLVETGFWAGWEILNFKIGIIFSSILLAFALDVEHSLTANVVAGRPLTVPTIYDPNRLTASLVEATGAMLWRAAADLGLYGATSILFFAVANFFEHDALIQLEEAGK